MKTSLKLSLIAALLVAAGFAYSQSPMAGQGGPMMMGQGGMPSQGVRHDRMGQMDPAKMQAQMDKRNAALKAQLKITPAQESAWTAYTAATTPKGDMRGNHPDQADMAKLTTPERLDKMRTLRAQHMSDMTATMDKHEAATKALYAVLTPEQQKLFDGHAMNGRGHGPMKSNG